MRKYLLFVILAIMAIFAAIPDAFAQGEETKASAKEAQAEGPAVQESPAAPALAPAPAAAAETPKTVELSIYGEAQNVNLQANSMTIQYYDYDNDEEKSTEITLDGNSKLENAKAIGDIKKGDWVDVTYTASAGKNIAKVVSVEKEEPSEEENAPAVEE